MTSSEPFVDLEMEGFRQPRRLTVIQIGNFDPPHSTENHLAIALEANGHKVIKMQENAASTFVAMSNFGTWPVKPDFILWTRTGWDWKAVFGTGTLDAENFALGLQRSMLRIARLQGVPTVAYHLDIFHRLNRAHLVNIEPFFSCDLVVTADGSSDEKWAEAGVNHLWFQPGVSRGECGLGTARDEFASKIAFVGSWQGHYHDESKHRHALVEWLRKNYTRDCAFWPKPNQPAVRGADLRDLYASVDVLVGDSCFSGDGIGAYSSDRIPESLGRGGYLLHPHTPRVTDGSLTPVGRSWLAGQHLTCWDAFNWDELGASIEWALTHADERRTIARAGREFTLAGHTYEARMNQLVDALTERGML